MKRTIFTPMQRNGGTPPAEMLDLRRELVLEVREGAVNETERTVDLSFASETPYERWFGFEILDCSPGAMMLGRLNNGGALLKDHDRKQQTGVVVRGTAKAENKKAVCTVKFSKSALGSEEMQDVKDGIRTLVSVGYIVHEMVLEKTVNGVEHYRVTKWEPYEVSIVSIPADPHVGVGNFKDQELKTITERQLMLRKFYPYLLRDAAPATTVETGGGNNPGAVTQPQPKNNEREAATKAERERTKNIRAVAEKINTEAVRKFAEKAIEDGMSVDDFNKEVLQKHFNAKPIETHNPAIGMNDGEVKRFSLLKACRELALGSGITGLEKEACEAAEKHMKREKKDARAIVLPDEVSRNMYDGLLVRELARMLSTRAQNAGDFTAGGALIQPQFGPMIELLRNKTILGQLGITMIDGLVGNFVLPQQTGGATAYWVAEDGSLTDTQATFAQKVMVPHRLGATLPFTTQFLAQASISAEEFLRNELAIACMLKKDLAGLEGSGVGGEPLGLKNTTGINSTVTYGGAPTWADVVEHETGIAIDNADIGTTGWALSAQTVGKWKTTLKDSVAGAGYLIEGGAQNMSANGYSVKRTNQITGNISFFGVWAQLLHAMWAGVEIIVDPFALKKSGQIEITRNELCDFLTRQPLAFNLSTDSAAQ